VPKVSATQRKPSSYVLGRTSLCMPVFGEPSLLVKRGNLDKTGSQTDTRLLELSLRIRSSTPIATGRLPTHSERRYKAPAGSENPLAGRLETKLPPPPRWSPRSLLRGTRKFFKHVAMADVPWRAKASPAGIRSVGRAVRSYAKPRRFFRPGAAIRGFNRVRGVALNRPRAVHSSKPTS